ncbi:MAG: serine/threonine-protein kinase [Anaerolineales bacterium]|nr:serine/threonine-protein kinase [Anaerolineales bacterium]
MSQSDPLIGTRLGAYEVIEAIGEGGMARIYRGFHTELNRYAAIKVINWGLQEDPEFTERFRREAQAIASLRHPNIVQIYDFGKHASGYFMAMEFIEGSDLAVRLRQLKADQELLAKDQVIRIIKDVAAALDYAHEQGVIHRDVKPSNIMINRRGQSILTDFGLVMLPAHASQATLGNTFGTPHYVAPEQAISSAAAVPASDVYSLGVILFELTTGQLPFDDESPLSVALKHVSDLPPSPRSINPDLEHSVEDVILRALSKDPSDRFISAGDMALALQAAWSNGVPTSVGASAAMPGPILPPGVPPASEVKNITLPDVRSVSPVADRPPDVATSEQLAARPKEEKSSTHWLPMAFVGLGGIVIGALALLLYNMMGGTPPTPTSTSPPTPSELANAIIIPETIEPVQEITDTPTASPTATATPLPPTDTPTDLPSDTPIPIPTDTPSPVPTDTPTATDTTTATPSATPTSTLTPTLTPTPTPEGLTGKILFKTDRSGRTELYQMDSDGRNQAPLDRSEWDLYTQYEQLLPVSSDGQNRIVVRGEGQYDLWWVRPDSRELRVTSTGQPEYDAAWSPVDNRIAYVSEETGNGDIYVLNLDGSSKIRLTENTSDFDKHPTWSPDGSRIAFWSDMGFANNRQIFVVDLATREITSLSDNPFNDWDPIWVH